MWSISFIPKTKIEVAVDNVLFEHVIAAIRTVMRTGKIGVGK